MGYDQHTVPNDCSCQTYFCCFPLALANIKLCLWPPVPFFQISLKNVHSKPPTIPFRIVACTFSDNLYRNSCIYYSQTRSSVPPKNPLMNIYYSKVESVASCRFQIDLCILACVMSREFTREAVMKFLPAPFS